MRCKFPLLAVDVGNSRIKLGVYRQPPVEAFPDPDESLTLPVGWSPAELDALLPGNLRDYACLVASVNRAAAAELSEQLRTRGAAEVRLLEAGDLPLAIRLEQPERVGMDRLVGAVAAARLRDPARAAILIDLGTAITVDLVAADGAFEGGAILPGIGLSARALHQFTDLLPLVPMVDLGDPPPALGRNTDAAVRSGLYWGSVGGVRELARRMSEGRDAQIFLTGGAAPLVARLLEDSRGEPARFVPHLTLAGIVLAACLGPTGEG